jgi:hypothetical protein
MNTESDPITILFDIPQLISPITENWQIKNTAYRVSYQLKTESSMKSAMIIKLKEIKRNTINISLNFFLTKNLLVAVPMLQTQMFEI